MANEQAPETAADEDWFVSFGDQGEYAEPVLQGCLVGAFRFLAAIVDEEAAEAAMTTLLASRFPEAIQEHGWHDLLFEDEGWLRTELPMGELFEAISGYAYHGLAITPGKTPEERRECVREMLEHFERLYAMIPFAEWGIEPGEFENTVLMARGRWALDNGEPIEPRALALFGRVTERRIRNMMSKTENLLPNADGRIPAADALDWLRNRKSFTPSTWQQDARFARNVVRIHPPGELYFVPVGPDDTYFHPGLKRNGVYRIGEEDDEQAIEDYETALDLLQRMERPVWRRPTPRGHWTRVKGVRWDRMRWIDLEALAEDFLTD